ncbi:glycosyltransferase [Hymenobacter sp. BT175]|uniref:glycosyltransferase n=1 Tax=Hymenobacter translucens TaxID=2886507 RepID=UPI001D0DEF8D|nr:glycosyltransferase [Hymenobacter translucens]MCC2547919.1 glycosyltransferase [Hymenobacter translucens]
MEDLILTIAIPTYNRADLLGKALAAVHAQIGNVADRVEVVISNNASTDHTKQIIDQYGTLFRHFRYFEHPTNTGPDANIAQAFRLAKGRYAWVLSDDDILLPNTLENIVRVLERQEIGLMFLTPIWYNHHIEDARPNNEPFAYQVYDNPTAYLEQVGYWITFISGIITNKSLVQDLDVLYKFQNTNLIQIGWTLPAIFRGKPNVKVSSDVILGRAEASVNYKFFKVHSTNFNLVMNGLVAAGHVPVQARDIVNRKLITELFPQYIAPGKQFINGENPYLILLEAYWRYPAFWLTLVPIFFKRLYVPALTRIKSGGKALMLKLFGKVSGSHAYSQAELTKGNLRHVGIGTYLPSKSFLQNPQCITLGRRFHSLDGLVVNALTQHNAQSFTPSVVIGDDVSFGANCHIACINQVTIGNGVVLGGSVYITDHDRDESPEALQQPPAHRRLLSRGPVVLHDNVLVEHGACILPGVTVGRNAIIRANSVVREDVAPFAIVGAEAAREGTRQLHS